MTAWLGWLVLSTGLTVLTLNRAWLAVVLALALRVGVPSVASHHLSGSLIPLHPASTFVIVRAFVPPLLGATESIQLMAGSVLWHAAAAAAGALLVETRLQQSTLAPLSVVNAWVAPLCFVLLLFEAAASPRGGFRNILRAYYLLAAGEAALAIAQMLTQSVLVYSADRASLWWAPATFSRPTGTLDSPLDLSMYLSCALPLLRSERRPAIVLPIGCLIVAGVVASESRTGILLAVPVLLYVAWGCARSAGGRAALASGVVLLLAAMTSAALATGSLSRFTDSDGANSNAARASTRSIFYNAVKDHWLVGGGSGYSFQVTASLGSRTSLEDGVYMTALDMGALLCALVLIAQIALIVRAALEGHLFLSLGCAIAVIYEFSYSGFDTPSANSTLTWLAFGLASVVTLVPSALAPGAPDPPEPYGGQWEPEPGRWPQVGDRQPLSLHDGRSPDRAALLSTSKG